MPTLSDLEKFLQQHPDLAASLNLKWSSYIPHQPTPKQRAYLVLPHEEAFYGGAAGGGKSDALLMGALQYVDVPGYSAILFRKTLSDLKLPSSLLSRAHDWLADQPCKYVASEHCYYFPTMDEHGNPAEPSRVQFGYIGQTGASQRYRSAEFQYIAFDELTQFMEDDYLFLFSRLRKRACPIHKVDSKGKPIYNPKCHTCNQYRTLPLRMRSASNPGDTGHQWVKDRFEIKPVKGEDGLIRYLGHNKTRPYIPAFVFDNPYLDQEGYSSNLDKLDPVTRERLKAGDWGVSEDSRFKQAWARYYSQRGDSYVLGRGGVGRVIRPAQDFQRLFFAVDPAGSAKESPGDTKIWRKEKSYTVIGVFGLTYDYHLLWLDNLRIRVEIPDILNHLATLYKKWRPHKIIIEGSGLGRGVYQLGLKYGLPIQPIFPHADKLVRATDAMVRMEQGRIWLPEPPGPAWLPALEGELFTWTGDPLSTDDQIDVLAYAAMDVSWEAASMERESYLGENYIPGSDCPTVVFQVNYFGNSQLGELNPRIENW